MKKFILLAISICVMAACYTPLNNSGVSTNKPWIDIPGTRLDFNGDQYDSCVKFNLRFWPQEAADRINLSKSCITACCWRSEQNEIVLDFNKDFEKELAAKGRARKYTPGKVTLKVTHSNFVNLTKVTVSPVRAINNKGLLKLSYETVENPARLAQLRQEQQSHRDLPAEPQNTVSVPLSPVQMITNTTSKPAASTSVAKVTTKAPTSPQADLAKVLLQQRYGTPIEMYFYQMNKTYRKQGAIFMISDRLLQATPYSQETYLVTCHAKARTGMEETQLKAFDFSCGKWLINITDNTVVPYDTKAKAIAQLSVQ